MVAPMVESCGVCLRRESAVRRSLLCWCVWQESGFSRREEIYFIKKFYKCRIFNTICRDNAGINCITVQHKNRFIPVNVYGKYATLLTATRNTTNSISLISFFVRFQFLTATSMKVAVFWDVAPRSLVYIGRRFREACCFLCGDKWIFKYYFDELQASKA
jgi:hypothetical protein